MFEVASQLTATVFVLIGYWRFALDQHVAACSAFLAAIAVVVVSGGFS